MVNILLYSYNLATMESVARQQAAGRQFRVRGGQAGVFEEMNTATHAHPSESSHEPMQWFGGADAGPKVKGPVAGDGCLNLGPRSIHYSL